MCWKGGGSTTPSAGSGQGGVRKAVPPHGGKGRAFRVTICKSPKARLRSLRWPEGARSQGGHSAEAHEDRRKPAGRRRSHKTKEREGVMLGAWVQR